MLLRHLSSLVQAIQSSEYPPRAQSRPNIGQDTTF